MAHERRAGSFQATALVNEAYLRLLDARRVNWQDRAHFLATAARLMRRVLVDRARQRGYQKRGGAAVRVTLDEALLVHEGLNIDLLALDEALTALAAFDERACRVIEMRYFAGLTAEETAAVLDVSVDTVMRDARCARAWLARRLSGSS